MTPECLPGISVEPTTYRDDYRPQKLSKVHLKKKREGDKISQPPKIVQLVAESHDTFQKLDYESRLPFDALWRTKEIVGNSDQTSLRKRTPEVEPEDVSIRQKIELVSPAVDLNDLKDPETRKLVLDFIYKTTVARAADEVWGDFNKTNKTLLNTETIKNVADPVNRRSNHVPYCIDCWKRNCVSLKLKLIPEIPASFKSAARKWDFLQDRTLVDAPKSCHERSALFRPVEANKCSSGHSEDRYVLDRSTKSDVRLRLPYEKLHISYGGHRTPVALGVPLEKKKISIYHPNLTVSQALSSRHD